MQRATMLWVTTGGGAGLAKVEGSSLIMVSSSFDRGNFWNVGVDQPGQKSEVEIGLLTELIHVYWLCFVWHASCIEHLFCSALAAQDSPLRPASAVVPSSLPTLIAPCVFTPMGLHWGLRHGPVLASCLGLLCSYVEGIPLGTLIYVTQKGRVH